MHESHTNYLYLSVKLPNYVSLFVFHYLYYSSIDESHVRYFEQQFMHKKQPINTLQLALI